MPLQQKTSFSTEHYINIFAQMSIFSADSSDILRILSRTISKVRGCSRCFVLE